MDGKTQGQYTDSMTTHWLIWMLSQVKLIYKAHLKTTRASVGVGALDGLFKIAWYPWLIHYEQVGRLIHNVYVFTSFLDPDWSPRRKPQFGRHSLEGHRLYTTQMKIIQTTVYLFNNIKLCLRCFKMIPHLFGIIPTAEYKSQGT